VTSAADRLSPASPSTAWLDLTGTAFSVSWVDAGGIATRSLRAGDGPPVVFLHGTSGHLEAFTRNIPAHVAAGYSCHAIDMLGHGYTGKPDYDYEIPRYVEHLTQYLDACGLDAVNIAGESLGGWVGAWFASEHPERVTSLQLIAAGGTKANPEVMERIRTSTRRAVSEDDVELTRSRLHLLMHDPELNVSDELVEVRHRIYHQPEFVANIDHLLCLQDMETRQRNLLREDRLAKLAAVPTLIIWGRQNPFGDVPEAHKMHEDILGSRLELYENCGHWPQHEHAETYNRMAIEFLDAHNRRAAG
jgi:2-hydroxy-6-oxonona-2,4-dienedioate hydrolase